MYHLIFLWLSLALLVKDQACQAYAIPFRLSYDHPLYINNILFPNLIL